MSPTFGRSGFVGAKSRRREEVGSISEKCDVSTERIGKGKVRAVEGGGG